MSTATAALAGVVPPVCTPFTDNFEIDVPSLRRLVDHLIDGGVHGLFALGSTSEVAFLTDDRRARVLTTMVEQAAGRVPVIAGAIDMTPLRVVEHVRAAIDLGATGIVATAPFYTRTHPVEIAEHFRLIKRACGDVALYAYDIPVAVGGLKLDTGLLLELGREGTIAGVKDSSGNDASIRALVLGRQDQGLTNFSVLTGSELTVDSALAFGADGVVPGIGNIDPSGYVRIYQAVQSGDLATARLEQERLFRMFDLVNVAPVDRMGRGSSALGAFKAGLKLLGVIDDARMAPPAIPLNDTEIQAVARFLTGAGLLT